jgi:acetamidase/formamidase
VLTIDPGDTVVFTTLNSGWELEPRRPGPYRPVRQFPHEGDGHALTGPVAIRGARPGMTLEIDIGEILPGPYGACSAGGWESAYNERMRVVGEGIVHAYTFKDGTGVNQHGHEVTLRPFLGIMGMPPAEPGVHSTVPPRITGGNLDCNQLTQGSTLYLPIAVDEGLFSAGDGHAAQGDGEVAGTAIECAMERAELTFHLSDLPITTPTAITPTHWITMGLDEDLDTAAINALNAMLDLLQTELGLSRRDALAYAGVHVDLRITQIVNETKGVHAVLERT